MLSYISAGFFFPTTENQPEAMTNRLLLSVAVLYLIPGMNEAKELPDTSSRNLAEIVISAQRPNRDIIPVQTLSGEELHRLNSNSVTHRLRYCC